MAQQTSTVPLSMRTLGKHNDVYFANFINSSYRYHYNIIAREADFLNATPPFLTDQKP